jgi:hypothetical protein
MYHAIFLLQPPMPPGYLEKTMVFTETQAELPKARYFARAMDARTVARIAGAKLGTLNAWVQRGLIPSMSLGTKGRPRDIDNETALRIAIFAELVRFGRPPDDASQMAWGFKFTIKDDGFLVVPGPESYTSGNPDDTRLFGAYYTPHPHDLAASINRMPSPPRVFLTIDVGKIAEQVRQAEQEWQQRRGGQQPDG